MSGIGGLTSIEHPGRRRRARPQMVVEVEPLPLWQIGVRVAGVLAVAMLASSLTLWAGIAYSGDETGTINTGNLVQFVLGTFGLLFGLFVVPSLITVFAARHHMARSRRTSWLVVGVLFAVLTLLTLLAALAFLGPNLWGEGVALAWPGLLVTAVLTVPVAPWSVRPLARRSQRG